MAILPPAQALASTMAAEALTLVGWSRQCCLHSWHIIGGGGCSGGGELKEGSRPAGLSAAETLSSPVTTEALSLIVVAPV